MTVGEVAREAYREALPVLLVSAVGGLFAGVVLGGMEAELTAVPGLLLLVPALLATRGNVYGSLGARLGSALHQGLIEPRFTGGNERLRGAVAAAMANGVLVSLFAAVAGFTLLFVLARPVAPLGTLVAIAVVAGFLSGFVLTAAVVGVVFVGYRRGINPDTLAGPVVTTTGDVVGIAMLLLATRFVLLLGGV
ncbi:magnesium transporter [Halorientalis litorea]|jgi:mgtE-like transporter|uniref:magnesium transporter n=1 Tax=Halorientalis litorea TaxID=2931977 RepID=UPI001FF58FF3|nr:magnesium transporter [Halorientalis litorea]